MFLGRSTGSTQPLCFTDVCEVNTEFKQGPKSRQDARAAQPLALEQTQKLKHHPTCLT